MTPRHATTASTPAMQPNTLFDLPARALGHPGASGGALDDAYWLAFTGDHDPAAAAAVFVRRYGRPPAYVVDGLGGLLLVGPIPSEVTP